MKKNFVYIFIFVFSLSACSYFNKKNSKSENQNSSVEIDTIINLNAVDAFPLFPSCDGIPSRDKQRVCFQVKISEFIHSSIQNYEFTITKKVHDTAFVKIKIDQVGKASLSDFNIKKETHILIPRIDSLLKASISELPIMKPAIKRSFPVATEFTMPILIEN